MYKAFLIILFIANSWITLAAQKRPCIRFTGTVNCNVCDSIGVIPKIQFYFNSNLIMEQEVIGDFKLLLPDTFSNFPEIYITINVEKGRRIITNTYLIPFIYLDSIRDHSFDLHLLNFSKQETNYSGSIELPTAESEKTLRGSYLFRNNFIDIVLSDFHYAELHYGEFSYSGTYQIDASGVVKFRFGQSVPRMFSEKTKRTCFKPDITGRIKKSNLVLLTPCGDWKLKLQK